MFNILFNSKNKFKEGMIEGAKPFEEKFRNQENTIKDVGREIKENLDSISDIQDVLINELSSKQKKEVYDLNTLYDVSEKLNHNEKEFLAALLVTILSQSSNVNEFQQIFVRSVLKYIGVLNPQPKVDITSIENIENIIVQKTILQIVMELLFLENFNHSYFDKYENLFSYFSVNNKTVNEIRMHIDNIYNATGALGITEKYGYVMECGEIKTIDNIEFNQKKWEDFLYTLDPYCIEKSSSGIYIKNVMERLYAVANNRIYYIEKIRTKYKSFYVIKSRLLNNSDEKIEIELDDSLYLRAETFTICSDGESVLVQVGDYNYPVIYFLNVNSKEWQSIEGARFLQFWNPAMKFFLYTTANSKQEIRTTLMRYSFETYKSELISDSLLTSDNHEISNNESYFYLANRKLFYAVQKRIGRYANEYIFTIKTVDLIDGISVETIKEIDTSEHGSLWSYFREDNDVLFFVNYGDRVGEYSSKIALVTEKI